MVGSEHNNNAGRLWLDLVIGSIDTFFPTPFYPFWRKQFLLFSNSNGFYFVFISFTWSLFLKLFTLN